MMPDWTTFNGYAGQYVAHPLTADPGDTVRFYVVDAGPSLTTAFHVVGTILDTAYPDGDMNPAARSTASRPSTFLQAEAASSTSRSTTKASTLRQPLLRKRRHGTGRPTEGWQPERHHVPLAATTRRTDRSLECSVCRADFFRRKSMSRVLSSTQVVSVRAVGYPQVPS